MKNELPFHEMRVYLHKLIILYDRGLHASAKKKISTQVNLRTPYRFT